MSLRLGAKGEGPMGLAAWGSECRRGLEPIIDISAVG